ncbi:MAG: hypothetical protein LBP58_03215 [Azoarcus sp.]|jgi:hypothetical protein|nr:hypothetical protein [Azoarcus sp.]
MTFNLLGNYSIVRGIPWMLFVDRKLPGENRAPANLSGCAAQLEIYDVLDGKSCWQFAGNIPAPLTGRIEFFLSPDETDALTATEGRYRVVTTDSRGNRRVMMRGRIAILESDQ